MIILIWYYHFVVVVIGKMGDVRYITQLRSAQSNVTMFTGCHFFGLIHVIKNDEAVFCNEMSSVMKREPEFYIP